MTIRLFLLAALTLAVAACQSYQPRYYSRTPFWPDDVAKQAAAGGNTVDGTAMFSVTGGRLSPCTAIPVRLVPDSPYIRQRLMELFGSDVAGTATGIGFNLYGPEHADWRWLESGKTTSCAGQGAFSFQGVADGTWYVVATWVDSSDPKARSYSMFKRVVLAGSQTAQVALP